MEPILSVIIAAYNEEKYIRKCISSILANDVEAMEIIVVDDGSTDNTYGVCSEIAKEESRIVLIHQENAGVSAARNAGLKIARGEYFAFVDADDYVDENMYPTMLQALRESGSDVCCCGKILENENISTNIIESVRHEYETNSIYGVENVMKEFLKRKSIVSVVPWNKVARRSIQVKYSVYFDETLCMLEDGAFCCSYLIHTKQMTIIKAPLYHYVMNDDNVSGNYFDTNKKLSSLRAWHYIINTSESISSEIADLAKARCQLCAKQIFFETYIARGQRTPEIMPELKVYRKQFWVLSNIPFLVKLYYFVGEYIVKLDLGVRWAVRWKKLKNSIKSKR